MQSLLGLFAIGSQRSEGACEEAVSDKLCKPSPTIVRLNVVRENRHNKCVSSTDASLNYSLHKASLPYKHNQYQWEITDGQGDHANAIVLKHGEQGQLATIERQDGSQLLTLHQGGFYTLNKFKWGSKTYRWTVSGCSDSRKRLQIKLLEDGSRQELALVEGPGTSCKSYWIQNPALSQETITIFGRTDYPSWMQVVVASGLVAAKTVRRMDKSLQACRR